MLKKILLADQDETYVTHLEKKFADELGDKADIHVVTDPVYLQQLFEKQQNFDIVLLNENLYMPDLTRHNIGTLFILFEEEEAAKAKPNGLYKYVGMGELFAPILRLSGMESGKNARKETRIVLFYAPAGGVGQTTLSAGICAAAAKQFQRALFIGLDSLQTSGYFMPKLSVLPPAAEQSVQSKSPYVFDAIKPLIATGLYDMLPPFAHPLEPSGILLENILHLVKAIKESEEYDLVVLDAGRDFGTGMTKLMAAADRTVLLTAQDKYSVHKLKCLLNSIDCSDRQRFTLVCNRYNAQKENVLTSTAGIPPCEYVAEDTALSPTNTAYLAENKDIGSLLQKAL